MAIDDPLLDRLTRALEQTRLGAPPKPVSVTLPAPLAEAFRLLVDRGAIDSVSVVAAQALEDVLQAMVVGMRLDALYTADPDARPEEDEVADLARATGLDG